MAVQIAVTGANGRMGREVLGVAVDRQAVEVAFAVNRSPVHEPIGGVEIESADRFEDLLAARSPDAVIDFTGPGSSTAYAAHCADNAIAFVTGTTGFDEADQTALAEASERTALLHATNFSRGIAALRRAVTQAVEALPGYDIEVTETHHNGKRDAPSGTANTLIDDIEGGRTDLDDRVHGRVGETPRSSGEIGVHARRAGDIAGEHEVLLAGNNETVSLRHRAGDRSIFAIGAIDAAEWLAEQPPGRYDFFDVIDDT